LNRQNHNQRQESDLTAKLKLAQSEDKSQAFTNEPSPSENCLALHRAVTYKKNSRAWEFAEGFVA
jgi:hypothetical protein